MILEPFLIEVDDEVLSDLRRRVLATRWPPPAPGPAWGQGTDPGYLQRLLAHWSDGFDWRAEERRLNRVHQFRAKVDGVTIHFVHERAAGGPGIPLLLLHGWPSCFVELLPLVGLLTDPGHHGIDGPAFDVVVPSLPGYGFSERPRRGNYRDIAALLHGLMQGLGYARFGAGGGDFGAGVATVMALDHPESMLGIHLSTLELSPHIDDASRALSDAERTYMEQQERWERTERGYSAVQSTKPQTLAYALNDSPAGLAAWILEKWRSWTDSSGDLDRRFTREFLLTMLTVYWVTGSITTSMRDYYDNRWDGVTVGPETFITVPTGVANFANEFVPEGRPPREWAERLYNVCRWTEMPRGGHFAPAEEPQLLAADIAAFFAKL
ncbi:MAG: epoxide hydrolase family protein [Candidatus Dormiibacterota bacterium]